MFVDASVIVAILASEADGDALVERLGASRPPFYISPLVVYEAVHGLARAKARGTSKKHMSGRIEKAQNAVSEFLMALEAVEISVDCETGRLAIEASKQFGKATGHPADLNFGDCFTYACAKLRSLPLLYKGNDFSHTDLA